MDYADYMNMQHEYTKQFGQRMNLDGHRLSIQFFCGWRASTLICKTR
jgi:hypothetical protein